MDHAAQGQLYVVLQQHLVEDDAEPRWAVFLLAGFDFSHMPYQDRVRWDHDLAVGHYVLRYLGFDEVSRFQLFGV